MQPTLERLITLWRQRTDLGEVGVLDSLCADYPDLAEELTSAVSSLSVDDTQLPSEHATLIGPAGADAKVAGTDIYATSENVSTSAALAPSSPSPVQRLGRYEVIRKLGHGAFGDVFLGFDEKLQRHVAIKVPKREMLTHRRDVDQFLAEARSCAALKEPGIVTMHDCVEQPDGTILIVMEYVDGGTLETRLKQLPKNISGLASLPANEVAAIGCQIADALGGAHERGLVHRDLKPANLLIDGDRIRVTDFGLAVSTEAGQKISIAGTPAYMSPEQIDPSASGLDARSDIWSIGVILYQCALGQLPFTGDRKTLFESIQTANPLRPRSIQKSIPVSLEHVILRCLEKNPEDRYATVNELANELRPLTISPSTGCRWEYVAIPAGVTLTFLGTMGGMATFVTLLTIPFLSRDDLGSFAVSSLLGLAMTLGIGPPLIALGNWCCCRRGKILRGPTPNVPCRVSRWAVACLGAGSSTAGWGPPMFLLTIILAVVATMELRRKKRWISGYRHVAAGLLLSTLIMIPWSIWWWAYAQVHSVTTRIETTIAALQRGDLEMADEQIAQLQVETQRFPVSMSPAMLVAMALDARTSVQAKDYKTAIATTTDIIENNFGTSLPIAMAVQVRAKAFEQLDQNDEAFADQQRLDKMPAHILFQLPQWD